MVDKVEEMKTIEENFNYSLNDKLILEDNLDRKIFINSTIEESTIDTAVYQILRFNAMDLEKPIDERKPIRVYINSLGGSIIEGFSLVDAIILSKTPEYTINLGACMSMALLVFMAGHKRYSMPRSEFLLHSGSTASFGNANAVKDQIEFESIQLEGVTKDFVLEYSKIPYYT